MTEQAWSIRDLLYGQNRELFLTGSRREIPSGQDGPILLARVRTQDSLHLARSRMQPKIRLLIVLSSSLQVILFVGATAKYATNNPYVRFFNDSQTFSVHTPASGNRKTPLTLREEFTVLLTAQLSYCDEMLSNVELMKETNDADLVVGELWYLCSALVADKLSVPHVLISPATLSTPYTFALGLPAPLAYVPQINNDANKMSNIIDRGKNVLQWISLYWYYLQDLCSLYGKIKAKYNITSNKSIQETLGRADLIIGQMPFGLEHPRPVHPSKSFYFRSLCTLTCCTRQLKNGRLVANTLLFIVQKVIVTSRPSKS